MEIREFTDLRDQDLEATWRRLEREGRCPNIFMSYPWVATWTRHFGAGSSPLILLGLEDGEPRGIAPLFATPRQTAEFPVNFLSHRAEFIVEGAFADGFIRAALAHVSARGLKPVLRGVPRGSITGECLPAAIDALGYRSIEIPSRVSPYVDIGSSWDEYYEGRKRKVTHEWERKMRKLDRTGAAALHRFDASTNVAEVDQRTRSRGFLSRDLQGAGR